MAAGCGLSSPAAAVRRPLLVVGIDGLEWRVLLPLLARGELPTFATWMEAGQAGILQSMRPTKSPVIWTTIATGKRPHEHGILDYTYRGTAGEPVLFTSRDRRVPALWNIASEYGLRSAVIGWWMTDPVEAIDGVMVAQANVLPGEGEAAGAWKGSLDLARPEQVFPPDLAPAVRARLLAVEEGLDATLESVFGGLPSPLPPFEAHLWRASRWAIRADAVYLAIAEQVLREADYDLVLLYLGAADVLGHRLWRYYEPERFAHPPTAAELATFQDVLPAYYRYVDRELGRLWSGRGDQWNLLVVSDHGMVPHHATSTFALGQDGAEVISGHHFDAPPGVIIAVGADLRGVALPVPPSERSVEGLQRIGTVFDVAPTVLALLGLPVARDMVGRPLDQLFSSAFLARTAPADVASHDGTFARSAAPPPPLPEVEQERLEQLRALGYLGDDD